MSQLSGVWVSQTVPKTLERLRCFPRATKGVHVPSKESSANVTSSKQGRERISSRECCLAGMRTGIGDGFCFRSHVLWQA